MSGSNGGVTGRPVSDRVVGKIKEAAGSLVGNEGLQREGKLHQERSQAVETADEKRRIAEEKEEEADIVSRQAALRAEEEKLDMEDARALERHRIEEQKRAAQGQAEAEKSVRAAAINAQTAAAYRQASAAEADAIQARGQAETEVRRLEQVAQEIESTKGAEG